jgi:aspartyl protease family protein
MASGSNIVLIGVGLIAFAFFGPSLKPFASESSPAGAEKRPDGFVPSSGGKPASSTQAAGNGSATRDLVRSPDGHFYADAQVNGAQVHFMIDTGASMVALTPADAQRAGVSLPSERSRAMGAGGAIEVMPVMIERVALGPLEARDVRGAVVPQLGISLLGQSYLERVGNVEIHGDRMVLR